jgi:single-strand DNA-binding protein
MLNNLSLVGRITKDPEVKFIGTESTPVVNFGIAVNRVFKNKAGEYEADFFNCSAFGKTAEFMGSYVKKGNLIGITGNLTTRQYDKEGQTHYVVEVRCNQVLSYESKKTDSVIGKFKSVDDVKATWTKEYNEKSVGLDEDSKEALKQQLTKKYQPEIDRISDLPF